MIATGSSCADLSRLGADRATHQAEEEARQARQGDPSEVAHATREGEAPSSDCDGEEDGRLAHLASRAGSVGLHQWQIRTDARRGTRRGACVSESVDPLVRYEWHRGAQAAEGARGCAEVERGAACGAGLVDRGGSTGVGLHGRRVDGAPNRRPDQEEVRRPLPQPPRSSAAEPARVLGATPSKAACPRRQESAGDLAQEAAARDQKKPLAVAV